MAGSCDSLSFALNHIQSLISGLNKKNFKSSCAEINHLVQQHGSEAERHAIRCLFSHIDFSNDGKTTGKDYHQIQYLTQEFGNIVLKPNFVSLICYALDKPFSSQKTLRPQANMLHQVTKVLKLNKLYEVLFGIALMNSTMPETRNCARTFVQQKLPEFLRAYTDADSSSMSSSATAHDFRLADMNQDVLRLLVQAVLTRDFGINAEQRDTFMRLVRSEHTREGVPLLSPLLYQDEKPLDVLVDRLFPDSRTIPRSALEVSLADVVLELGANCSTLEDFRKLLSLVGARDVVPATVAKVLGTLAKTVRCPPSDVPTALQLFETASQYSSSPEPPPTSPPVWNVIPFVDALLETLPALRWRDVVAELDYPSFSVTSRDGFLLLMTALVRGLRESPFPVELIYQRWKNAEGQLSFVAQALRNPDALCFGHFSGRRVASDMLKMPPEYDEKLELLNWKSLDLVESLLRLSDCGVYSHVLELFRQPLEFCPDLLLVGVLQAAPQLFNTMKRELIYAMVPLFLTGHPNANSALQYAWYCQANSSSIRTLMLHAVTDWYVRTDALDGSRLSRIVDVMHELKALSTLLNSPNLLFVIDLACLAARREYVKLDKFLTDKMREHGEPFVQAVINFLRRRCPTLFLPREELLKVQLQLLSFAPMQTSTKAPTLSPELVTTILGCLQTFSNATQAHELVDTIMSAVTNGTYIFQAIKQRERTQVLLGAQAQAQVQAQTVKPSSAALLALGSGTSQPASASAPFGSGPFATGSLGTLGSSLTGLPKAPAKPSNTPISGVNLFGTSITTTSSSTAPSTPLAASLNNPPLLSGLSFGAALAKTPSDQPTTVLHPPGQPAAPASGPTDPQAQKRAISQLAVTLAMTQSEVDVSRMLKDLPKLFGEEVESDANAFFKKIFSNAMPLDEILQKLKEMSMSEVQRSRDGYYCILRNLLEEHRFYQQYPYEALLKTGMLIGGLIDESLVQASLLAVVLFVILDALKQTTSEGGKMFDFACTALDRCRTRLKDYPAVCAYILRLGSYSDMLAKHPQLAEFVDYASRALDPPARPSSTSSLPQQQQSLSQSQPQSQPQTQSNQVSTSTAATKTTAAANGTSAQSTAGSASKPLSITSTNIATLEKATEFEAITVPIPTEQQQDRIFFIFNNLSQTNMAQKAAELRDYVPTEYLPWVAQYLVMKRVTIEPNFHGLYASFVDALAADGLHDTILKETYRNIHILLLQPKEPSNFTDRGLLKSLGHWLGLITLARNKPILHEDLDLKSLLYEAFHRGVNELNSVVPFVGRILESCATSRIFRPPNPWTLGLLNVFAELRQQPDVKLSITFEVEMTFRQLNVPLDSLTTTGYLANTARMAHIDSQLTTGRPKPVVEEPAPRDSQPSHPIPETESQPSTVDPPGVSPASDATATSAPAPLPRYTYDELTSDNFLNYLEANESLPIFQRRKQLRMLLRPAAERTYQELTPLIIDRIALTTVFTTESVVTKDFAYESDENRLRQAARAMCRSLAAAMALALARDLITAKLKEELVRLFAFSASTPAQHEECEMACEAVALDNSELLCAFIQKNVIKAALELLERRLQGEYEARRLARQEGRIYYDSKAVVLHQTLPDAVRAAVQTPLASKPSAAAVYDEFARNVPGFAASPTTEQSAAGAVRPTLGQNLPHAMNLGPLQTATTPTASQRANDLLSNVYDRLVAEVESRTAQLEGLAVAAHGNVLGAMRALHDAVVSAQRARDIFSANALVGKVVENLLETYLAANFNNEMDLMRRFGEVHVEVLKALADRQLYGVSWTVRQCTKTLIEFRSDSRFNIDAVELLLKSRFVNMQTYDAQLALTIESHSGTLTTSGGPGGLLAHAHLESTLSYLLPIAFAIHLLNRYCVVEARDGNAPPVVNTLNECELYLTIEQLNRIVAQARHFFEQHPNLLQLYERTRQQLDSVLITTDRQFSTLCQTPPIAVPSTGQTVPVMNSGSSSPLALLFSGMAQSRDADDPPGLREKSEALLAEWAALLQAVPGSQVVGVGVPCSARDSTLIQQFVTQLQVQGIFKSDETITRFLRINLEHCIEYAYGQLVLSAGGSQPQVYLARSPAYARIDSLVRLIALIIKNAGSDANPSLRINLLNRVLGLTAGLLVHDIESARHDDFQNMPYHRILVMLLNELTNPDSSMDYLASHVTIAFYNVLNVLRPSKCPGFVFSWLELVAHRTLLSRCVAEKRITMGYSILSQLLLNLFKFLAPYLRNIYLTDTVQTLYRGVMRFMLVLLHDFPEFLAESYYALIDALPLNCIQLRNVILSASPRGIRLPDPIQFVRLDSMSEVQSDPRMTLVRAADLIRSERFKSELDGYLKTRTPVTFLSELRTQLLRTNADSPYRYNVQLLNGLVLYVGIHAVSAFKASSSQTNVTPSLATVAHTPNMDIFQTLAVDLDSEGRYLFLNAIANHLRYPNTHTHYFHCVLLYLYKESNLVNVQEQITRVLLERVIVLRPHPWGILVTLIELLRKPEYKFWQHEFLRFAPEIERLFDSVARSCLPQPLVQQALAQLQAGRAAHNPTDQAAAVASTVGQNIAKD